MSSLEEDLDRFRSHEITVALEMVLKDPKQTVMKLRVPIPVPSLFPWEYFLRINFDPALPHIQPYHLDAESFSRTTGELVDTARPRSYFALFRFLEFMRAELQWIEDHIPIIEEKYRHFKFRAKQMLDRSESREKLDQNIKSTLIYAHNMVSHRAHVQSLYESLVDRINSEIAARHECNLRKIQGSQSMEKTFHPDYGTLMKMVQPVLRARQRLERILDNWKSIQLQRPTDAPEKNR